MIINITFKLFERQNSNFDSSEKQYKKKIIKENNNFIFFIRLQKNYV